LVKSRPALILFSQSDFDAFEFSYDDAQRPFDIPAGWHSAPLLSAIGTVGVTPGVLLTHFLDGLCAVLIGRVGHWPPNDARVRCCPGCGDRLTPHHEAEHQQPA